MERISPLTPKCTHSAPEEFRGDMGLSLDGDASPITDGLPLDDEFWGRFLVCFGPPSVSPPPLPIITKSEEPADNNITFCALIGLTRDHHRTSGDGEQKTLRIHWGNAHQIMMDLCKDNSLPPFSEYFKRGFSAFYAKMNRNSGSKIEKARISLLDKIAGDIDKVALKLFEKLNAYKKRKSNELESISPPRLPIIKKSEEPTDNEITLYALILLARDHCITHRIRCTRINWRNVHQIMKGILKDDSLPPFTDKLMRNWAYNDARLISNPSYRSKVDEAKSFVLGGLCESLENVALKTFATSSPTTGRFREPR